MLSSEPAIASLAVFQGNRNPETPKLAAQRAAAIELRLASASYSGCSARRSEATKLVRQTNVRRDAFLLHSAMRSHFDCVTRLPFLRLPLLWWQLF